MPLLSYHSSEKRQIKKQASARFFNILALNYCFQAASNLFLPVVIAFSTLRFF